MCICACGERPPLAVIGCATCISRSARYHAKGSAGNSRIKNKDYQIEANWRDAHKETHARARPPRQGNMYMPRAPGGACYRWSSYTRKLCGNCNGTAIEAKARAMDVHVQWKPHYGVSPHHISKGLSSCSYRGGCN